MNQAGALTRTLTLVGLAIGAGLLLAGFQYYVVPIPERPFSPLHDLFAPSGLIGQGFGIVGTLMIVLGVSSYSLRKRFSVLARFGKLRTWLQVHIFLCLLGPFLVLLHTTFKFGGIVSISFWSMTLVVASGVFGRWVYVWIPRTANGHALGYDELRGRLQQIFGELEKEIGMSADQILDLVRPRGREAQSGSAERTADRRASARSEPDRRRRPRRQLGILGAVRASIRYRLTRGRALARYHETLAKAGVGAVARERIVEGLDEEQRILQQLDLLIPFQAAFRYWHAFHLPLAIVMALVLVVHVGVAIAFGYTWIWAT